jgi:hypothetical protein
MSLKGGFTKTKTNPKPKTNMKGKPLQKPL